MTVACASVLSLLSSATDAPFTSGTLQVQLPSSSIDYSYTAYHDDVRLIFATDTAATTIQAKPGGKGQMSRTAPGTCPHGGEGRHR